MAFEHRCSGCGKLLAEGEPHVIRIVCPRCRKPNIFVQKANFRIDAAQFADTLDGTILSARERHTASGGTAKTVK